jgi:hypothetical protein
MPHKGFLWHCHQPLKDFYDLWPIAETFELEHAPLPTAIRQTFARRATALPEEKPTAFTESYATTWDVQWRAFLTRERMTAAFPPPSFQPWRGCCVQSEWACCDPSVA